MADSAKDIYVAWLNDAHSMEQALVQILENQVNDAKDYPEMQQKLQQHLEQTRQHAEMVKGCVERLGGNVSSSKSFISQLFGKAQSWFTGPAEDEAIKDALQDYAAENFEVASYRSLITAATELGDTQTAQVCQQILAQDQAMADWIGQQIPLLTQQVMGKVTANA